MPKRNPGRAGRSRKRRPPASHQPGASAARDAPAGDPAAAGAVAQATRPSRPSRLGAVRAEGARPRAPWHPLPLSELLILLGAVATVVGMARGLSADGPTLAAGVGAVLLGTLEVTIREHRGGYRSHTVLLSLAPVLVFHTAVVLIVGAVTSEPRWLTYALVPVDVALFALLFKALRVRFQDASRRRILAERLG